MGDVVNLRQARKQRKRADKERNASENRRKFGRTKADKQAERRDKERDVAHLDGHKRDSGDESA